MPQSSKPSTGEIGSHGLAVYSGRVYEEWKKELVGSYGVNVYREMYDTDAVVGAIFFTINTILSQAKYKIVKGKGRKAVAAKKLLEDLLEDMDHSFHQFVAEALSMLQFGWSWHEIVYKRRDDGRWGWSKFSFRSQDTLDSWHFDATETDILGMIQKVSTKSLETATIPRSKSIHCRTSTLKNNPEGRSVLRSAYRAYYFKKRLEEIEAIGIERDLAGLPVIRLPPEFLSSTASEAQRSAVESYKDIVKKIRRDESEGLVFPAKETKDGKPTGYDIELMASSGKRQMNVSETIKRYDQRIAMSLLCQFILLGTERAGSFALVDRQATIFTQALQSFLIKIADAFNKDAVLPLMLINGFEAKAAPKIQFDQLDDVSLNTIATFVNQLVGANVLTPDDDLETYLRELADFPPHNGKPRVKPSNPMGAGRPSADDTTDRNNPELNREDPEDTEDPADVRAMPEEEED